MYSIRVPLSLIALTLIFSCSCLAGDLLQPGQIAHPFTLDDVNGLPVSLQETLNSGPTLLVFFRTDCSHCKIELPLLQKLSQEEAYAKLRILAVSVREKVDVVTSFIEEHGLTFPVVIDSTMKVTRTYGVPSIPRAFFLKRSGELNSTIGSAHEDVIREHIDNLLNEGGQTAQKVLIVVPDMALESGSLTVEAAKAAGYEPVVWDMAVSGVIPEEELRKHLQRPVIRCLPQDKESHAIGRKEEIALLGLLSDGGKLLLVGNDLAKSAHKTDLLRYYVTLQYKADDAGSLVLKGEAGDPDFSSFNFQLREKTTDGEIRPDLITPAGADAVPILRYDGIEGDCAALLVKT